MDMQKDICASHFSFHRTSQKSTNPTFLQQLEPVTRGMDVTNCSDTAGLVAAFDNSCLSVNYMAALNLINGRGEIGVQIVDSVASSNSTARASNAFYIPEIHHEESSAKPLAPIPESVRPLLPVQAAASAACESVRTSLNQQPALRKL